MTAAHDRALSAAHERIDELEEENRQLREKVAGWLIEIDMDLRLTPKELAMLRFLAARAPRVASIMCIFNGVWTHPDDEETDPKVAAVILSHLRKKIAARGAKIVTHWGHGYSISREDVDKLTRTRT